VEFLEPANTIQLQPSLCIASCTTHRHARLRPSSKQRQNERTGGPGVGRPEVINRNDSLRLRISGCTPSSAAAVMSAGCQEHASAADGLPHGRRQCEPTLGFAIPREFCSTEDAPFNAGACADVMSEYGRALCVQGLTCSPRSTLSSFSACLLNTTLPRWSSASSGAHTRNCASSPSPTLCSAACRDQARLEVLVVRGMPTAGAGGWRQKCLQVGHLRGIALAHRILVTKVYKAAFHRAVHAHVPDCCLAKPVQELHTRTSPAAAAARAYLPTVQHRRQAVALKSSPACLS
jgi:hypothetical protein